MTERPSAENTCTQYFRCRGGRNQVGPMSSKKIFSLWRKIEDLFFKAWKELVPSCNANVWVFCFKGKNLGLFATPVCGPFSHVSVQKKHGSFYHDGVQKLVPFCNTHVRAFPSHPPVDMKLCKSSQKKINFNLFL